jgi:hypothetical protein
LPFASPRTSKLRLALEVAAEPRRLRRLYLLESREGPPSIARLPRPAALMQLAAHLYRLDPMDRGHLAAELDVLARIVSSVPVATLSRRLSFDELPVVHAAILADVEQDV